MVFINACHSEHLGKIFKEAGIPIVVSVQSDLKIADSIAEYFSNQLYSELLQGATIHDAFVRA